MNWDYAKLSKMAKEAGGPELLVDFLVESGKRAGRKEMILVVCLGTFLGGAAVVVFSECKKYIKSKEEIYQNKVETAKQKVVQEIKKQCN